MNVLDTQIPDVKIITPDVFGDARGYFMETWQLDRYALGNFVQDNVSLSQKNTLRGLHIQSPAQGKLVQVLLGSVFDVAVDVRVNSPYFGKWVGVELSAENHRQLWVPAGFAHGFCVTSETALFMYKCTAYYCPQREICIAWDDPEIGIAWPIENPLLSNKDKAGRLLNSISKDELPRCVSY